MNYAVRNQVMLRWGTTTFILSVLFSVLVAYNHPWNWQLPPRAAWPLPPQTPDWLIWPLVNTLLVLTIVWNETNRHFLKPFWRTSHQMSAALGFLQAWPIIAFSGLYSQLTLIGVGIILSLITDIYFSPYIKAGDEKYLKKVDYKDGPLPFCWSHTLVFVYSLIAFSGLFSHLPNSPSLKQLMIVFLRDPGICILLIAVAIYIGWLLKCAAKVLPLVLAILGCDLWLLLKKLGRILFFVVLFILLAIAALICLLHIIYVNIKKWLWPARLTTG